MSSLVVLDLLIPGMVCSLFASTTSGELSTVPTQWSQDESDIHAMIRDASQIAVAIDDQYWITKTITVPSRYRSNRNDVGIFELGASLGDQPDDFAYAILPQSNQSELGYALVSGIRKERAFQLFSSLISTAQRESTLLFPRGMALAFGWVGQIQQPRPSLLVSQHQGVGTLAIVRGDELLFCPPLRVRASRASHYAAVAANEIATLLENLNAEQTMPREILDARDELSRVVCFGDLDTEQVRSELVNKLNLVVESGSSAVYPTLPVPMRLRDSWLVATGVRRALQHDGENEQTEVLTIREGGM